MKIQPRSIEWPTLALAAAIYGGWLLVTAFHDRLPVWALPIAGGWLVAWHGSLQHETIHGHPTRHPAVNGLIGAIPLSLWLPYRCYRADHLDHHCTEAITDPHDDPESRYLASARGIVPALARLVGSAQATLAGRMLLGPPLVILDFLAQQARRAIHRPGAFARDWAPHILGVALILGWLAFCRMGIVTYLVAFVYPGTALSLLRSFAEHRAAESPGHRVAVVESFGPFALLFLFNNLHAAHHRAPGLPWFRLPGFYRENRAEILHANGGLLYFGYREILRRYAWRPHDVLIHPFAAR